MVIMTKNLRNWSHSLHENWTKKKKNGMITCYLIFHNKQQQSRHSQINKEPWNAKSIPKIEDLSILVYNIAIRTKSGRSRLKINHPLHLVGKIKTEEDKSCDKGSFYYLLNHHPFGSLHASRRKWEHGSQCTSKWRLQLTQAWCIAQ